MPAPVTALTPLRDVVGAYGLDARKSLGQHFLLDANLIARIARQAGDLEGRHIAEIGPGPGGLTRALLDTNAASVTAIEIDHRAVRAITELQAHHAGRLHLIEGDALALDLTTLIPAPRQIIANLPYNIGSPLLIGWLRQAAQWEQMTLMFQEEVADRICAAPGSDGYGRLSVLAQWLATCEFRLRIPPQAFSPPPKVMSAVIVIRPHAEQPSPDLFRAMERVTAAAFGQRRKMLRGSLKSIGGERLLAECEIDGARRAETLDIAEFNRLAHCLLGTA